MGDTMGVKDDFKVFVKNNPNLVKFVRDGKKTWQDFFEMYSLYGEDSKVWKEYLGVGASLDFLTWLKSIDVDGIQDGISSIQRVLGVVQDFVKNDDTEDYQSRPLYKHFED